MDVTVYTISYNEEVMIQFMIDHYRSRFPNCKIVVYDNQSTDRTREICVQNDCEIRYYNSNCKIEEKGMWSTKNNCWRDALTDWIIVCDVDELLDINHEQLEIESLNGVTKIKSESWQMVNLEDNHDVKSIKYGYRDTGDHECYIYDKDLCFNKKYVDINYTCAGCHYSDSKGIIKNSEPYKMYHYRYVNCKSFCEKMRRDASRRSDNDVRNSWGIHCTFGDEFMTARYNKAKDNSIKILP